MTATTDSGTPAEDILTFWFGDALKGDWPAENRSALARLTCEAQLAIVPGATHLFEEPGALELVSGLARDWFARHLPR